MMERKWLAAPFSPYWVHFPISLWGESPGPCGEFFTSSSKEPKGINSITMRIKGCRWKEATRKEHSPERERISKYQKRLKISEFCWFNLNQWNISKWNFLLLNTLDLKTFNPEGLLDIFVLILISLDNIGVLYNLVVWCFVIEMAVPKVNENFLGELEAMGFPLARATRALHYSGESLLSWSWVLVIGSQVIDFLFLFHFFR